MLRYRVLDTQPTNQAHSEQMPVSVRNGGRTGLAYTCNYLALRALQEQESLAGRTDLNTPACDTSLSLGRYTLMKSVRPAFELILELREQASQSRSKTLAQLVIQLDLSIKKPCPTCQVRFLPVDQNELT
jgi:hypothetical protein